MAELRLPLWFATERKPRHAVALSPCDDQNATVVFTHSDALSELIFGAGAALWRIELVADHKELLAMIADLHDRGLASVRLNPELDGTGGEDLPLRALLTFADSLVGAHDA